jgi:hypothetical protein
VTERLASPDAHLGGLVDSIAAWLFPPLYPNMAAAEAEAEAEAEL